MSDRATAPAELPPTKTMELDPPITFGNKTYDRLDLHEPSAAACDKATSERSPIRVMIILVSLVSTWPSGAVEKLPISKLMEAGEYCMAFFKDGPTTGES
jgi:hypothetical protein